MVFMFLLKRRKSAFSYTAAIICSSPCFGQYVNQNILKVRTQSLANIESMIAGKTVRKKSSLIDVASPIKKSSNPEIFYNHVLAEKKEAILGKFQQFGVDAFDLSRPRQQYQELYENSVVSKKRTRQPSLEMQKKARTVFSLFTDQAIPLIEKKDVDSPAAASDYGLSIDEPHIKRYKSGDQEFILAHEIMHFLEKHSSEEAAIEQLLKEKHGKLTPTMNRYLLELSRCNETIADVKAVVRGGLHFAKSYENFAKKEVDEEIGSDEDTIAIFNATRSTHPARPHRYDQAKLLKKELELLAKSLKQS